MRIHLNCRRYDKDKVVIDSYIQSATLPSTKPAHLVLTVEEALVLRAIYRQTSHAEVNVICTGHWPDEEIKA